MKTPQISLALTGGILVSDAAGHYPGLELFNYVYGTADDILTSTDTPTFTRTGLDFARRLVWDPERFAKLGLGEKFFVGENADEILRHLLSCLQLRVPDRKTPNWEAAHFFPYSRSLIHWDARNARSQGRGDVQVERRYLRGGGALAYKVLRTDPDPKRRAELIAGFRELMPKQANTPLERLAAVLASHSKYINVTGDEIEQGAQPQGDELDEQFRAGMARILSHTDISSTARVKAVVNWTGMWLTLVQRDRAARRLGQVRPPIIVDCGSGPSQLRRESARALKDVVVLIGDAAEACLPDGTDLKPKARRDLTGFFTRTCAWTQLVNAFTGKRHFTIGLDLLEALVLSQIPALEEVPFEAFIDKVLNRRFGIVVGREAAAREGLLSRLDASMFEDNEDAFAAQLSAAGFLKAYSDSTRMVGFRNVR